MKARSSKLLALAALLISGNLAAQNLSQSGMDSLMESQVFTKTEIDAQFPGGKDSLAAYIRTHTNTELLKSQRVPRGTYNIPAQFIVDKYGNAKDFKLLRNLTLVLDDEALRLLRAVPKWTPARQNGRNVTAYHKEIIVIEVL
jgi:periplasmic protein TonB